MESNISDWSEGFQRISLCTHITALKLFKNFLLVAESNEIQIYDWKLKKLLWKRAIFDSCSIHGIRISNKHKFLFFGAKHIKILSFIFDSEIRLTHSHAVNLNDWILDVQWISKKEEMECTVAALTAHNCLILLKETGEILQSYHCAENCILYSASIISCESHSLVLAVGTVFQKILLWSPFSNQNGVGRNEPFQQLSGHQGVIFSVTYNEHHKIICSTSDDRSLRVWKVHNKDQFATSLEFWKSSTIESIYVLFAHESRVWRSVILDSCILSIGEDSFICVWSLEGRLLKKFKGHKNGSIWCIETSFQENQNQENLFAFTGGSDGGVYIWDVTQALQSNLISQLSKESKIFQSRLNNQNADIEINIVDHLSTDNHLKKTESNFPRLCSLYTEGDSEYILVYMGTEKLSMYNLKSKSWEDVFLDHSISNYCILSISSGSSYIALGTFSGELILVHRQELSDKRYKKFQVYDSMICSLQWCSKVDDTLLSCGTEGHLALWSVSYDKEFEIQCLQNFFLPKCKSHWWSTTALYLSSERTLIVGDRGGSVSIYSHSGELDENNKRVEPVSRFRNIHGDNGVTDIQEHGSFIYSSGRDGKVNQYAVVEGELKLLHALKVSHDLEWIGRIIFYENHLLLVGFHTKNFVVWSSYLESAVMTVECGGGHRSWDFSLTEEGMATFVAIQKKDIIYYQQNLRHMLKESVLKDGLSGQKICCLTYLFTEILENQNPMSIVLCGGEDNTLRVIGFIHAPDGAAKLVSLSNLSGHLSNIRAIGKEKMVNSEEWLLASVGGRSQLIIWKFKYDSNNVICEQLNSTLLLGCSEKSNLKSKENNQTESQTRLMDVSISRASGNTIVNNLNNHYDIGVACSDGYFRLYNFDIDKKELTLKHTFKHDENCILKLVTVGSNLIAATQQISYIIGATNGSLKVLRHDNLYGDYLNILEAEDMRNCHKSGINALDFRFLVASVWMICSGGDDNSLMVAFTDFEASPSVQSLIKVVSKYHYLKAHASQITGVKILDPFTIVSTSVDQRLNVWKVNYITSPATTVTINLHRSVISLIPDIANMECWKSCNSVEWNLAVCGQVFEVFRFTNEDKQDFKELILHFLQDPYPKMY